MRPAAPDLSRIFRRFSIVDKASRLPDDVRRASQSFTAFIGSEVSAVSATTNYIFSPAFYCDDRARDLDDRVPDSRQVDRVKLQKRRSVQLRRRAGAEELPYRRIPDAQRRAGETPWTAGAQRWRGQRRTMRSDEPGNRRNGYPGRVREYPGLWQFFRTEPLRGAAVSAGVAQSAGPPRGPHRRRFDSARRVGTGAWRSRRGTADGLRHASARADP